MLSGVFLVGVSSLLVWVGTASKNKAEIVEHMTEKEAMWFPLLGSGILLGLFLAIKFVPPHILNMVLNVFFLVIGTFAMYKGLHKFVCVALGSFVEKRPAKEKKKADGEKEETKKLDPTEIGRKEAVPVERTLLSGKVLSALEYIVTEVDFFNSATFLFSLGMNALYIKRKYWLIADTIAASLCITALGEMRLDSVKTGLFLLSLLFLYDIFWVFCTPVMVSVAKGIDLPMKIVFPAKVGEPSMIGLGDIVIPGLYLGAVREFGRSISNKAFFYMGYTSYIFGLVLTFAIAVVFKSGQPALLYLCPATILSTFGAALAMNKHRELFNFRPAQ
jgi:minor histocompatibility antigen H13